MSLCESSPRQCMIHWEVERRTEHDCSNILGNAIPLVFTTALRILSFRTDDGLALGVGWIMDDEESE